MALRRTVSSCVLGAGTRYTAQSICREQPRPATPPNSGCHLFSGIYSGQKDLRKRPLLGSRFTHTDNSYLGLPSASRPLFGRMAKKPGYDKIRSYVEFITTPTVDTPGTLLVLHFDHKRYLIGRVGEGSQRACIQRGIGIKKVNDILLTGWTKWENLGGMLGIILSLADVKSSAASSAAESQRINAERRATQNLLPVTAAVTTTVEPLRLHGAPNLDHLIGTARRFIFRTGMPLQTTEHYPERETRNSWEPTWSDDSVRVYAMPIEPANVQTDQDRQPASPRKRSYDEMNRRDSSTSVEYEHMRKQVVKKMFDSDWRYDALIPMQLSDVKEPASIFIRDPVSKQTIPYSGPPASELSFEEASNITVLVREPWPGALTEFLPPTKCSEVAMSYIIRNHPQRGKFLPMKAKEFEIEPPSLYSVLANGTPVKNIHGRTITPDMVLEPGKQGGGFAVVDLPTPDHVESLIARPEWKANEIMDGVGAIIWILGRGLATDPRIREFQREMSALEHIVASPDCCPNDISISSAAASLLRYHRAEPTMFPKLIQSAPTSEIRSANTGVAEDGCKYTVAERGLVVGLVPDLALETRKVVLPMNTAAIESSIQEELGHLYDDPQLNVLPTSEEMARWRTAFQHGDVEIITLGTGSSHPSLHRNVSSTLVRVPGCGSYLLDAGEGTLGTLRRMFTTEELATIFKDLKLIWISHLHADHHLGLASMIKAWYQAVFNGNPSSEPNGALASGNLAVISDAAMLHWLAEYSSVEDFGYSRITPLATKPFHQGEKSSEESRTSLHLSRGTQFADPTRTPAISKSVLSGLSLSSLETVYVSHCRGAQAVSFTTTSGFKFSYSGDCRPSAKFATIGRGSHVLIHEATFEEEMRQEALAKRHSTAGEALVVATKMRAQLCLLTHFSQRYPTMPSWTSTRDQAPETSAWRSEAENEDADVDLLQEQTEQASAVLTIRDQSAKNPRVLKSLGRERSGLTPEYERLVTSGRLRDVVTRQGMRVITAFDYMRIKMRDIPYLEAKQGLLGEICAQVGERETSGAEEVASDDKRAVSPDGARGNEKKSKRQMKMEAKAKQIQANGLKNKQRVETSQQSFENARNEIVKNSMVASRGK